MVMPGLPGGEPLPDDLAPHVEAARAGFNAVALDMGNTMSDQGVENFPAIIITGLVEAAVQVYVQTMLEAGNPSTKVHDSLVQMVETFFRKHRAQ